MLGAGYTFFQILMVGYSEYGPDTPMCLDSDQGGGLIWTPVQATDRLQMTTIDVVIIPITAYIDLGIIL